MFSMCSGCTANQYTWIPAVQTEFSSLESKEERHLAEQKNSFEIFQFRFLSFCGEESASPWATELSPRTGQLLAAGLVDFKQILLRAKSPRSDSVLITRNRRNISYNFPS
ncbi:hypothetical protein L6164_010316 [Bauhinia variegata]|uniref:Uncharacterized protein n=1 Tax=Bauhinia variegata TaxID=167791 RepID=A0ACB9PQ84_BAUVA|nr:hypothetical protein L6164_010316 [Bauhinia variegata]